MPSRMAWLAIFVLLSAGCTDMQWYKPNASRQDLAGDQADCRAQIDANTNNQAINADYGIGISFSNQGISTQLYSEPGDYRVASCLGALGWSLSPQQAVGMR